MTYNIIKRTTRNAFVSVFICSALFTVYSCTEYNDSVNEVNKFSKLEFHRITAKQAKENALNFVENFANSTRAAKRPLTVSEVKAISKSTGKTRSSESSINLDTLFYVVNFDDNQGFVIAASDDRETPVFAYVEEGNYEEETSNNGYEAFMDALIDYEINAQTLPELPHDIDRSPLDTGGQGVDNPHPDKFEVMYPLLKTKWDQTMFNTYCPGVYTGCVVTAISQICSYLKNPINISWAYNGYGNQCTMEWDRIVNESVLGFGYLNSPDLCSQVSNLMRFWGLAFDAEYEDGGTGVDSDKAISKMQELGFNATDLSDYDAKNVMNDLKKGNRIIFMRGNARYYHVGFIFRKYVDGHAWAVDGYIHSVKNNKESVYIHCNWGWGGSQNGYFLSDVLNAEEGPVYSDNANLITRSSNYQYRLKTSTICK